ncbi:hypothetical protein ACIOIM_17185 [Streptomyces albidoflavus]
MSSGVVGGTALAPGDLRGKGEGRPGRLRVPVDLGRKERGALEGIGLDAGQERIYLALLAALLASGLAEDSPGAPPSSG